MQNGCGVTVLAADGLNKGDQDLIAASLNARFDIGSGYDLLSIFSFRDIEQRSIADTDFTGLNLLTFPGIVRTNQQISQEIRITAPSDRPLS